MIEEEVEELTPEQVELAIILVEKERECNLTLNASSEFQGLYCPGVFDGWVCWPDTTAGESASHPCPGFIVGFDPERTAYRKCEENGEWFFHTVFNKTWSNYTTCVNLEELSFRQTIITVHLVGYSISLVALIISLGILTYFNWVVLFSHPADFTPVCTTELGRIAVHEPLFKQRNVKLLAHSCDDLKSHVEWVNDIKSYCRDIPGDFPYPIVADPKKELAVLLNMMDSKRISDREHQLSIRALYIIDPNHVLRLSMHYPQSTGRNVDETLRVIDSLQLVDKLPQIVTPANWVPGEKVMIVPEVSDEEANKLFSGKIDKVSMPSGISYVRTTTNYK